MSQTFNIGAIEADLQLNSGNLERGLQNAQQAIAAAEREIRRLQEGVRLGSVAAADAAQAIGLLNADIILLAQSMQTAYAASGKAAQGISGLSTGAAAASKNMGAGFAMAAMQFGYMVDDIQYGFGSIVNNIAPFSMQISTAMGASAQTAMALGAATQVAAVAAFQLYSRWSQLMDKLGVGIPNEAVESLKTLQKELQKTSKEFDDLQKKPRLTLAEKDQQETARRRVESLEEEIKTAQAIEKIRNSRSRDERERGAAFETAAADNGPKKVFDDYEQSLKDKAETEGFNISKAEIRDKAKQKGITLTDKQVNELAAKKFVIDPFTGEAMTPEKLAQEMFRRASEGDQIAIDAIRESAEKQAGGFEKSKFAQDLFLNSPEQKKGAEEDKERERERQEAFDAKQADIDAEDAHAEDMLQESIAAMKRQRMAREKKDRDDRKDAKENKIPGLKDIAEHATTMSMATGNANSLVDVKKQVAAALQAQGVGLEMANDTVDEVFGEAQKSVQEKAVREALQGPDQEQEQERQRPSRSEQFDAASLAGRVQGGVNNEDDAKNERKKQTSLLDQATKYLAQMVRNGQMPINLTIK